MARRKKGGQKLSDLSKPKKPKIKVDLTPRYRPAQPPERVEPTGPGWTKPKGPYGITKPKKRLPKKPSTQEDWRGYRKPKVTPKPPEWLNRGYPQSKRMKVGLRTGASGLSKLVKAMNK